MTLPGIGIRQSHFYFLDAFSLAFIYLLSYLNFYLQFRGLHHLTLTQLKASKLLVGIRVVIEKEG